MSQRVLITVGAGGIGLAIAKAFVARGDTWNAVVGIKLTGTFDPL